MIDLASIKRIERQLGRPLRVLHIGNIANNAYNNAKIQRRYEIKADVLCYDYYHVMGCPEWEDASFQGDIGDPFFPNWWAVDLGDWQRPDWFVQGPFYLCILYMRARAEFGSDHVQTKAARRLLACGMFDVIQHRSMASSGARADPFHRVWDEPNTAKLFPGLSRSDTNKRRVWSFAKLGGPMTIGYASDPSLRFAYPLTVRSLAHHLTSLSSWRHAFAEPRKLYTVLRGIGAAVVYKVYRHSIALCSNIWKKWRRQKLLPQLSRKLQFIRDETPSSKKARQARTIADYKARYAALDAATIASDIQKHCELADAAVELLDHYDIVQGYSTDAHISLFAGFKAFTSYEHGTLRDIPFENNRRGQLCTFTYQHSPHVFVTNSDVLPSVERLALNQKCVTYLPHAFDDQKLVRWRARRPELKPPSNDIVFFSPTRHHWRDGNLSLTKGNELMLAAVGRLWAEGRKFQLVLVEWGQDVVASRDMIESLGFSEAVEWVPMMSKQELWTRYCTSHAVLDQFALPALGGVGFEALTLARPLVTRICVKTTARFFGAPPPVLPANSEKEIAASMARILDDPEDRAGIGAAGAAWIETWHSARRTVDLQVVAYEKVLWPQWTENTVNGRPRRR